MKISLIRHVAMFIYDQFNEDKISLLDWIYDNIENLVDNIEDINQDVITETVGDFNSPDYGKLVNELNSIILRQSPSNRVEFSKEEDDWYIVTSEFGKSIDIDIENELNQYFSIIEKSTEYMKKGTFYERFCTYFLQDLGLDAKETPPSNDKGIDIEASYPTELKEDVSKFVFDDKVYVLAQAKMFKSGKVDTPVLRKLVGDSIFLKFDQVDYLDISHNAVHLIVFSHSGFTDTAKEFAKKNKIMTVATRQLTSIIAAGSSKKNWKSLQFIREEIKKYT